jgi:methyltransferase-like protein/cyclopropane fatty-acyl-phospholipid synthase-like methyltransferase
MTTSTPNESTRATGAAYDETPYVGSAFPETHPDKLCAMARLFGLEAPEPARARVLELGCGDGTNLLPMAQHAPDARFLGIDVSSRHVASGQAAISACRLANAEIRQQDVSEFTASEGKFDYIIAHGIFSWVPAEVRARILALCRDNLSENGVAFVSYNTFPGWSMRMGLRDMLLFHTQALQDTQAKLQQARALTGLLADAVGTEGGAYGLLLRQELARLNSHRDDFVRHDLLGDVNQPFYFHEFIELAARANLQYLSGPILAQMLASDLAPRIQDTLRKFGNDPIVAEQYLDFVRNQNFRRTLLCHAGVTLNRILTPDLLRRFYYTSLITKPETGTLDLEPGVVHEFYVRDNVASLKNDTPFSKAVLDSLAGARLARISYSELVETARAKALPFLIGEAHQRRAAKEEGALAQNLAQLYMRGVIDIFAARPQLTLTVTEKPSATPFARYQATEGATATNRAHRNVSLDGTERLILGACNGERDAAGIAQFLAALPQEALQPPEPGAPLEREADAGASWQRNVAIGLPKLAAAGFF